MCFTKSIFFLIRWLLNICIWLLDICAYNTPGQAILFTVLIVIFGICMSSHLHCGILLFVYVTNTKPFQLKILQVSINKISYQVNILWKISTWTVVSGVLNNLHKPIFWELFKKLDKTFKKSAWKNHRANNIEKFFPRKCDPGSRTEIREMDWEWGRALHSCGYLLIPGGKDEVRDLQFLWT